MMVDFKLCDGTTVQYEPEYHVRECEDCGREHECTPKNQPQLHGSRVHRGALILCNRCGAVLVDYSKELHDPFDDGYDYHA